MPRKEWRINGELHFKEYKEVNTSPAFISEDLDFTGTMVEKILDMFKGEIVEVSQIRRGRREIIFSKSDITPE